ncbi:DUF262 domain-containing protein [Micromonospora carbonacea]|uniref:DUF262 domain-containing protein n=1 Tax=Micromonospora carbonacea TaxID=47853 RepID=UPI003D706977
MMQEAFPPTSDRVAAAEEQIAEQIKRIEFYITEYSVEILANKMRDGEYVVPRYQREFTWEHDRKSRFIESLIMGLPIPFVFFWEMPDGKLEIVDGSQRLRTIEEFILGELRLDELEQLTHLSGFSFKDLPESRQRKIRNRSIRGIVLNEHADEAARLDMFDRINTGSKAANKAEIRRGALAGPFLDLVIELATDPMFVKLAPMNSKTINERGREELVTRFFAYGDGLEGYKDRPADFMFEYSKTMNRAFAADAALAESYRQRFNRTMSFVQRHFPHGFSRTARGQATPRARFEAIAIGSYRALQENPSLANVSAGDIRVIDWLNSEEFRRVTGADGANAVARLRGRIEFVRSKLAAS